MDYAEITVDHKYHPHIIGKNGANGRPIYSALECLIKHSVIGNFLTTFSDILFH